MKTGKTIIELAAELERQKAEKRDFKAPTSALSFESNGVSNLKLGDVGSFEVKETAHDQFAQRLEIPKKYYDRMRKDAPKLLDNNVNHWLQTNKETRLVRTLDNQVRAFLSDKYRPLDNHDLAEIALPILMESGCTIESCEITEKRLYLKAVSPRMQYDLKVNDPVQAGIVISNSEIGAGSLSIEPLIFRLVCLNGLIVPDSRMRKYHVGRGSETFDQVQEFYRDATKIADDKAFWMKVKDTIQHSFTQIGFEQHVAKFANTAQDKIQGDPFKVIELAQDKFSFNDTESKGILSELLKANDMSRFGLINAVTAFAQTVDSYDRSTELERIGGQIIELPRTQWETLSLAA